jgi:hypothetical protein
MMGSSKKTISWSAESEQHKQYLNRIAVEKGFRSVSDMSRYALAKLFTGYKLPFVPENQLTARDDQMEGEKPCHLSDE